MPILHWLNDEEARKSSSRVAYRLLETDAGLSYGAADTENMLIQGDNLEALKALLPYYAGQVKCIYIDPPYNTENAFENYDDNLEHSIWLSTIYPRLELLWDFLTDDGSIWISIDDKESHYMKIIADELYGRKNFIASIVWQKRYSRENRETIGDVHEYIFVYGKNPELFKKVRNKVLPTDKQIKVYKNLNNDPKGRWRPIPITAQEGHATAEQFYEIVTPSGKVLKPPKGRCWSLSKVTFERARAEGRIYFGKKGDSQPNIIRYLYEMEGVVPWTWWPSDEVGHTDESKKELHALFWKENVFDTPKPERLIQRVLQIATNSGDLILDSFLGSGTTAAVAQKMKRRYIGIEMGENASIYCAPRLKKVIDGEQGGISKEAGWQGGGGFRFYRLGEAVFDEEGKINPAVKFRALAAHVWFSETHTPLTPNPSPKNGRGESPMLGIYNGTAYYLLYNGILGDKSKNGGNVLTGKVLASLLPYDGPKVIYGELTTFGAQRLTREKIVFKQVPYDIKAR
jgi:adenine-specific DNA-methyltransferase